MLSTSVISLDQSRVLMPSIKLNFLEINYFTRFRLVSCVFIFPMGEQIHLDTTAWVCDGCVISSIVDEGLQQKQAPCKIEGWFIPITSH